MFRPKIVKTEISADNFGAGSVIVDNNEPWLVVASPRGDAVTIVSMETFAVAVDTSIWLDVADPNWLSEEETRLLAGKFFDCAFSDLDFKPKGLKNAKT